MISFDSLFNNSNELAIDIWVETGILSKDRKSISLFLNAKLINKEIKTPQLLDYLITKEEIFMNLFEINIKSQDLIESLIAGIKLFEIEYPSIHMDGFISCFTKWFSSKDIQHFQNQEILYLLVNWYFVLIFSIINLNLSIKGKEILILEDFIERFKQFPIARNYPSKILEIVYSRVLEEPFLVLKPREPMKYEKLKRIRPNPLMPYVECSRYYEIEDYGEVEYYFLKDNLELIIDIFDSYYFKVFY